MSASGAMAAEFETVAEWTAQAARTLGPEYFIPAGCRGSGGPGALDWLSARLAVRATDRMVDVGAGVGGPAGYLHRSNGVRPLLLDPEAGACRAGRSLFGLATARADATALPLPARSFDVAWSVGVLCTIADHAGAIAELARVLRPGGRLGLLVYVADGELPEQPEGNHFPTSAGLRELLDRARLQLADRATLSDVGDEPARWQARVNAVQDEIERRHGDEPAWRTSVEQAATMMRLLRSGAVTGELLALRVGAAEPEGEFSRV